MRAPCGNRPLFLANRSVGAACAILCLFGGSLMVWADTPSPVHGAKVASCYCRCRQARGGGFCVKMCDTPRYAASHPWATRCVKPHLRTPVEQNDAGPRYPHPGRAERAQVQ